MRSAGGAWMRASRWLAAGLALLASGCLPVVDESQSRVCRSIIPALHDQPQSIVISQIGRPTAPGLSASITACAARRGRSAPIS